MKQNQRLRDDVVVIFQSLPPQQKSVKLQMTIKIMKSRQFIDPQHHNMNGQTTGITQWTKHGNDEHANCQLVVMVIACSGHCAT